NMCPKGKLWFDVLQPVPATGEHHALAALDVFSTNRYDVFWKHQTNTLYFSTPRRTGCDWKNLNESHGKVLVSTLREGAVFCVLGDAGGFGHEFTHIVDHSYTDTGGIGWISRCWDHWPIGWLNSQAHEVNADSLQKYPNHFSPSGMNVFGLKNDEAEKRVFYSLIGVGGNDLEPIREVARQWLTSGEKKISDLKYIARLPEIASPFPPASN
ncbi:MAG: hypothetical protein ABI042_09410, partial [Verrucomicrobiota bacterium]